MLGTRGCVLGSTSLRDSSLLFAASQMEIKKPFILSSMKLPLQDSNDKVSSLLLRVCLGAEVFPGPCPC